MSNKHHIEICAECMYYGSVSNSSSTCGIRRVVVKVQLMSLIV